MRRKIKIVAKPKTTTIIKAVDPAANIIAFKNRTDNQKLEQVVATAQVICVDTAPESLPPVAGTDFEVMMNQLERKYPSSIRHLKEIYKNRHGVSVTSSKVTLEEQVLFANEFFKKFGKPFLDPKAADIASIEGKNLVLEMIEKVCIQLEDELM